MTTTLTAIATGDDGEPSFAQQLAGLLPPHTYLAPDVSPSGSFTATWSTPTGVWHIRVMARRAGVQAKATITGPKSHMSLSEPSVGSLYSALRGMGAVTDVITIDLSGNPVGRFDAATGTFIVLADRIRQVLPSPAAFTNGITDLKWIVEARRRDGDACRFCGHTVDWTDRRSGFGGTYDVRVPGQPVATADDLRVACRKCGQARLDDPDAVPILPPPDEPVYGASTVGFLARSGVTVALSPPPPRRPDRAAPAADGDSRSA